MMLNERSQTQKDHILYDCLYQMSRIGKSIETESKLVNNLTGIQVRPPTTPLPTQDSKDGGITAKECEVSFKGDENVLELLVKVAYSCEYKKHPGVYT